MATLSQREAKLPVYEIVPGATGDGVSAVALVDHPAIEVGWHAFVSQARFHPNCRCVITDSGTVRLSKDACKVCREAKRAYDSARKRKVRLPRQPLFVPIEDLAFAKQEDRMRLAGPLMVPDRPIYRRDDDGNEYGVVFSRETVAEMSARFLSEGRTRAFNQGHDGSKTVPAYVAETWIVEDPENDKSRTFGFSLPKGTWFAVVQVEDRAYWDEAIRTGALRGFSVEGRMSMKQKPTSMHKFEAVLKDGTVVTNAQGTEEISVGDELLVVAEDGTTSPAPDGAHELEDGTIVVTVAGLVTEIVPVEVEEPEFDAHVADLVSTVEALKATVDALTAKLDATEERFAKVTSELEAFRSENAELKARVETFSKQPGAGSVKMKRREGNSKLEAFIANRKYNP